MTADQLLADAAHLEATAVARRSWADMVRRNAASARQPAERIAGFRKLAADADLQVAELQDGAARLRAKAAQLRGAADALA